MSRHPLAIAADIVKRLRAAGHEAYLVGGCVRDALMGRPPGDYDVVTSARPEEVQRLFPVTIPVGVSFGVVLVVEDGRNHEVATYRTESGYVDGRRPSQISFASLQEDVRRRDFTVNGLAMDPETGQVLDYVGGVADIRERIIRTIGPSSERFTEDHLRMLRAVRFAANLDFTMEPETLAAIQSHASAIHRISAERIREEMTKLLKRPGARRGLEMLFQAGLLQELFPEIETLRHIEQPPAYHPEGTVWEHTLRMFDALHGAGGNEADHRLAWAVMLHDMGKAVTRSEDDKGIHFYGHVEKGVLLAEGLMRRLKFSGADMETVLALIQNHMRFMHVRQMRPSTLKRFLRLPDFELHLTLHRLDCVGSHGLLDHYDYCREALIALPAEALHPPRLLTGHDLMAMGFPAGPRLKEMLQSLEDAQLNGEITDKAGAERWVMERWGDPAGKEQ